MKMLEELLGRTVEVHRRSEGTDVHDDGRLVAYDERWIKIEKNHGEILYFPITKVRLLKLRP